MTDDREAHRAGVEAGYATLSGYLKVYGDKAPRPVMPQCASDEEIRDKIRDEIACNPHAWD